MQALTRHHDSANLTIIKMFFVLPLLIALPSASWGQSANYKVHLDFNRPLTARVEAVARRLAVVPGPGAVPAAGLLGSYAAAPTGPQALRGV